MSAKKSGKRNDPNPVPPGNYYLVTLDQLDSFESLDPAYYLGYSTNRNVLFGIAAETKHHIAGHCGQHKPTAFIGYRPELANTQCEEI